MRITAAPGPGSRFGTSTRSRVKSALTRHASIWTSFPWNASARYGCLASSSKRMLVPSSVKETASEAKIDGILGNLVETEGAAVQILAIVRHRGQTRVAACLNDESVRLRSRSLQDRAGPPHRRLLALEMHGCSPPEPHRHPARGDRP